LGLEEQIEFVGFVDHDRVHRYISASDVIYGVVDSERPTNPLKCYESLACGRPVITSPTPEFEVIRETDAGLVIDDLTLETVAEAIVRLRRMSRANWRAMGRRGQAYTLEHHTWDALVDLVLEELSFVSAAR
jgi:glycosyltransferase involved in cell wall biosynthesis